MSRDMRSSGLIKTYALLALAARKAFTMWKFSNFICPRMICGEYTPAAIDAAPKAAPDTTEVSLISSMLS